MPLIAGSAAASLGGGILAGNAQKKAAREATAAMQAAMARAEQIIDAIGAPPDLSEKIILDQLQLAGVLTPELEADVRQLTSQVSQIQKDDQLRGLQTKALQEISKRGRVGLTPEERAQYNVLRGETQRDLEAKQQQIKQDLAMRGQAGGGAEIAARLLSSQESADRASEEADRISALASQRAMQAIAQSGEMAGNLRGQDFQEEVTKGSAADQFNRFNLENQMQIAQRNIDRRNVAQERNLGEKQRIQDTNVGMANQERYRQAEAKRQNWQDKLAAASAKIGVITGMTPGITQGMMQQGKAKANMWTGLAGGISGTMGALANQQNQDRQYKLLESLYGKR